MLAIGAYNTGYKCGAQNVGGVQYPSAHNTKYRAYVYCRNHLQFRNVNMRNAKRWVIVCDFQSFDAAYEFVAHNAMCEHIAFT